MLISAHKPSWGGLCVFFVNDVMKVEIDPLSSIRAEAFPMWITSPMPMVTLTKTFNVTRVVRLSRRHHLKLNMLMCWCIMRAASQMEHFYLLPEQGKLYKYDRLAINVIVPNVKGGINSCDVPFNNDFCLFNKSYLELTQAASQHSQSSFLPDAMIVGTSALVHTELDSIINQYTDKFVNPMVMWAKFRKHWFSYSVPISLQYHHAQMDGVHGVMFFQLLQQEIDHLKV